MGAWIVDTITLALDLKHLLYMRVCVCFCENLMMLSLSTNAHANPVQQAT